MGIEHANDPADEDEAVRLGQQHMRLLLDGEVLIKHGRRGKPKPRQVYLNEHGDIFCSNEYTPRDKATPKLKLKTVIQIFKGKETSILKRKENQHLSDAVCLSLTGPDGEGKDRTLDFHCTTPESRDRWVAALTWFHSELNLQVDVCNVVEVAIFRARELVAADFLGKSDPYCTIDLLDANDVVLDSRKTSTVLQNLNPAWLDPTVHFALSDEHTQTFQKLRVQVSKHTQHHHRTPLVHAPRNTRTWAAHAHSFCVGVGLGQRQGG
jgi:hypothetical protein